MFNICTISMTFSTATSSVLLTRNTRGPQNTILPRIKAYIPYVRLTHAYRALIRWSRINRTRELKDHPRRLATQAVIYKMATTSLSNCVSDTAKQTSFFGNY